MFGSSAQTPLPEAGIEIQGAPSDTVSSLIWSPTAQRQFLMGSSWDKSVRVWEVDQQGNSKPVMKYDHETPVLGCDWTQDAQSTLSCDAGGKVMLYDVTSSQSRQIGAHTGAVTNVRFCPQNNVIMSVGLEDRHIRYWDGKQQQPVMDIPIQMPNQQTAPTVADARDGLLVVGMGREYLLYDLRNPGQPYKKRESLLTYQVTCIAMFNNPLGWAEGSIEGRVAINTEEDPPNGPATHKLAPGPQKVKDANFTFRCHRRTGGTTQAHTVNAIAFNKAQGTFATCGSDGYISTWCRIKKRRIREFQAARYPVTAVGFSEDSRILAYAIGYDWSQGHGNHNPSQQTPAICLKRTEDEKGSLIEPSAQQKKKY